MWLLGALIGAALAFLAHDDLWFVGAILGAAVGWLIGRGAAQPKAEKASALERRLAAVERQLVELDRRLTRIETPVLATPPIVEEPRVVPLPEPEPAPIETEAPEPIAPTAPPRPTTAKRPPKQLEDYAVWRWLTGGNTVVRVGIVILFFGVAFLLRYAYEHVRAPIELRLTGIAIGAIVLLAVGWRLRTHRAGYALALQGGGIGILYLLIFAAFRLYQLVPPTAAFVLLVGIAAFSAVLAVAQDSRALAVLGASGGFLAPVLASTGGGNHVALFSYYAILNAGILGIAWFKAWRILNLVGFAFTFLIGTLWGVRSYSPEHFATTEPFLILFFLFYLAIPLMFARQQAGKLERYVDGTLVFGVPLVAFGLQVGLVREIEYGAAWSALALAALYLILARVVFARAGEALRLLAESFLALGVVFGTLTIPLALDGRWTSAAWALEGAAIVWIGVRQQRAVARAFGIALQILAGVAFLAGLGHPMADVPVANSVYLGCVFVAVAGLFCAWYLDRRRDDLGQLERIAAYVLFVWGLAWWVGGALNEIDEHVSRAYGVQAALLFATGSCALFSLLHQRIHWRAARYPALALLPSMAVLAVLTFDRDRHPFAHIGYVAWPLAFVGHYWLLRRHESEGSRYQYWLHAAGVWLLAVLASSEVAWAIDRVVAGRAVWPLIAWALVPGAMLYVLARWGKRVVWPVAKHFDAYYLAGAAPLAVFLGLWALLVNFVSSGNPAPLPYVPILNPLDLAQVGAVLMIALWFVAGRKCGVPAFKAISLPSAWTLLGAGVFVWANAVLLRTLHHWAGVPFSLEAMLRSTLVETSLSLFWTLIALGAMVAATRRAARPVWLAGAGLMAVVVAKLFLVDLSNVGTVERIVSFIGVGVLMLVIGYFSPVPPKARQEVA
jgi:uncharacterized membrane protein